jgi:hypothetical protein
MSIAKRLKQTASSWRSILQITRAGALVSALLFVLLIVTQLGVDRIRLVTPARQLWIHLGRGKVAVFVSDETGDLDFHWRVGWNSFAVNDPSIYFHPKNSEFDILGLEYVDGHFVRSPFRGGAVGLSYWYFVLASGLLAVLCNRKLRRSQPT